MNHQLISAGGLLLAFLLSSCTSGSAGPELFLVNGTVNVDGTMLGDGSIAFESSNGTGGAYGGKIINGKYSFRCSQGIKKVSIYAYKQSETLDREGVPEQVQFLPERYNSQTVLNAEVSAINDNSFDFDLNSNKSGHDKGK